MTESSARSAAQTIMTRRAFIGAVLLACLVSGSMAFGANTPDEEPLPPMQIPKTGMHNGRITAMQEKSTEINGNGYDFDKNIVFANDEGRRLVWNDFWKGSDVQYHLSKGKIDFLILFPRK